MKASSAAAAALSALIGADTDPRTLPFDEANRLLERIANTPDESLLDALYCRFDRDQRMIPSTPAWIWFKEGELALVGNRLVFFQEKLWSGECKHLFAVPLRDAHIDWWTFPGTKGFKLSTPHKRYRISLVPPRGTQLKEVSGAVEHPSVGDVMDLAADSTDLLDELLGETTEVLSMFRTYKVAAAHERMWRALLSSPSSGLRQPPESAAPPAANTRILRPNARRDRILQLVGENPDITVKRLAELMDAEPSQMYGPVRMLIEHELLRRDGRSLRLVAR